MTVLKFDPPGIDAPGYLRRQRHILELYSEFKDNLSPGAIDGLVEIFLGYVTEPEDRDEAREALLDASEAQIRSLMVAITGGGDEENPTT